MRNENTPWTTDEINILCRLYPLQKAAAIMPSLPIRSKRAIYEKAQDLMLRPVSNKQDEVQMIANLWHEGHTADEIARLIGYSRRTIFRRLNDYLKLI